MKKKLPLLSFLFFLTLVGVFSKYYQGTYRVWVRDYFGDIISVMFVFFVLKMIFTKISFVYCAVVTFLISVIIEFSQLIKTPFLIEIRKNFLVSIIMGQSFDRLDFLYYIIGIVIAFLLGKYVLNLED